MRGGTPYELMIGRRYLRSSGNRFLSFISLISMLGVAIGVAVLIVVLSVMNGFERELRSRILSVTSHATISAFGAGMADWPAARRLALGNPSVRGAAPFVEGEALLIGDKTGAGSAAASVRGVLPELEAQVSAVGERLSSGAMSALQPGSYRIVARRGARQGAEGRARRYGGARDRAGKRHPGRGRAAVAPVRGGRSVRLRDVRDRSHACARPPAGRGASVPAWRPGHGTQARDARPVAGADGRTRGGAGARRRSIRRRLDQPPRELLPFDRAHQADDVLHPAAGGRGCGVQHRLDAGDGGEGQAARHRHTAHDGCRDRAACSRCSRHRAP